MKKQKIKYPYSQFLNHFNALQYVLKYEIIRTDYDSFNENNKIEVGNDHSIEFNIGRIMDYMTQLEYNIEEIMFKSNKLIQIAQYISLNAEYFNRKGFYIFGKKDGPSLVAEPLLHALYNHFVVPGFLKYPKPKKIIKEAKKYKEKDSDEHNTL